MDKSISHKYMFKPCTEFRQHMLIFAILPANLVSDGILKYLFKINQHITCLCNMYLIIFVYQNKKVCLRS